MKKADRKVLKPEQIPAVEKFLEAEERLKAFKAEHYDVFSELEHLLEERNTLLQEADKAVRAAEAGACGPFKVHSTKISYDPEKLYEEVGRDTFLDLGGRIETKAVYDIDRGRIEAAIARGALPDEVIDAFRTISVSYTGPKPIKLP